MPKNIGFQVSDKDYYFLKRMAKAHGWSISREIREVLRAYYNDPKNKK